VFTTVQVKTAEDEIHEVVANAKAAANGGSLRRESRSTHASKNGVAKKVELRQIGVGDDTEDSEDFEEHDDEEDEDYQPNDDKEDDDKEDDDKEDDDKQYEDKEDGDKGDDERSYDDRSDEGSDYGGDYGVDPELAGRDFEAEDAEEGKYYELDAAPRSTAKKTQTPEYHNENKIRRILEERHMDGQRQCLVDWYPSWTSRSSLPASLLDEWTKKNIVPKVQPPKNDDEDALMWQLIQGLLHKFGEYMYPDPSQGDARSAAGEFATQLFRNADWKSHHNPANLRHLSRQQIVHKEENATAAHTLRRVFIDALRQNHDHPWDRLADHDYDDILVQYTGDIATPPILHAPQPSAGVPIHSLIWPLLGQLWDLLSPSYDGAYLDRAELPRTSTRCRSSWAGSSRRVPIFSRSRVRWRLSRCFAGGMRWAIASPDWLRRLSSRLMKRSRRGTRWRFWMWSLSRAAGSPAGGLGSGCGVLLGRRRDMCGR
jgi:hypothetical protein